MSRYLIAYVVTAVIFLGLDFVYLSLAGGPMYRQALGDHLANPMRVVPGIVFYVIYIFGLQYFAVSPAFQDGQWTTALVRGAVLGFIAYATYEFTNYATLARWTGKLVLVDMVWGTVLSGVASSIAYALTTRWTR